MIIITLAGESSRFFNKGYSDVKYKLKLNDITILENILNYINQNEKIIIVLNKKFDDFKFVQTILDKKFNKYYIVEIENSKGQLDSVYQALVQSRSFWTNEDRILIFNGDTIRRQSYEYTDFDGAIECFLQGGNHWSFVNNIGIVDRVTEKNRISDYCSTGLYEFRNANMIIDWYPLYTTNEEYYVAPFYNFLIEKKFKIYSYLSESVNFDLCGTPNEYENTLKKYL